jgi:AP-1-like transcription factor
MSSGTTHDDAGRFFLTPQQQSLLFAALNSNKTAPTPSQPVANKGMTMTPDSYQSSPVIDGGAVDNSFLPNYDYGDFGDTSFDFSFADDSQASMIGELPGSSVIKSEPSENDSSDKRAHPDDEDDDEDLGSDPKRRESTDKAPKKPGRKPLTSEPTSVRSSSILPSSIDND